MRLIFLISTVIVIAYACTPREQEESGKTRLRTDRVTDFEFQSTIKYADQFSIIPADNFKQIIVLDPWNKGDTLGNYVLYPKGSNFSNLIPGADAYVEVPVENVVTLSSSHLGMIDLLDEVESLVGITDADRIYNRRIHDQYRSGKTTQVGSSVQLDLERIMSISPDLIIKTGFNEIKNEDQRMKDAGLALVFDIEWMESTLLGRAEWIKFIAAFYAKEQLADSVFSAIEREYMNALKTVTNSTDRPSILFSSNYKGTWYMPGGESYIAKLVHDARGDYYYRDDASKGSQPLSFEVVLEHMQDADIWLNPRSGTMEELLMMDERYELFTSFQNKKVFNNDNRLNERGANDYWESGVARPDLILKDIINILHPGSIENYELTYYRNINFPRSKTSDKM